MFDLISFLIIIISVFLHLSLFSLKMYSIYITNKSSSAVYVRVQQQNISSANPHFCDDLSAVGNKQFRIRTHLLQWGFCEISPDQTIAFSVDIANEGPRKYASLYGGSNLCIVDFEINCLRYGCLFIKRKLRNNVYGSGQIGEYFFYQANPQPVWIPVEDGQPLPDKIIEAGAAGFGRSPGNGETPLKVILANNGSQFTTIYSKGLSRQPSFCSGTCLSDTGHEFVPANTGDPVPPHAVIGGVSVPDGSLYLGRVGGNTPCVIEVEKGKVKSFCYDCNKVQSGEILILTNDPNV